MGKPEISLRVLNLSDVDDFMIWATDDRVSHFCRWDTYTSKEDALDFIRNIVIPHPWFKAICIDNKPVGAISVEAKEGEDRCRREIGYVIASGHWGKGIATVAVKMVMETIFKDWQHLERLEGELPEGMDYSRITLRPFKLSDIDDFEVWVNDDQVIRYTGFTGFTSKEDGLRYLREVAIPHPCVDLYV
ncbi:hypothetical protein C5167_016204 [Papaver somniferum]|nr:hypothetical protein C5167_016204 [Papaver somniferum]